MLALRTRKALKECGDHGDSVASGGRTVKLPKIELPKFGGEVLEWGPFWDQFEATVDGSDLPDVSKLVYLRSLLYGEAKQVVEGVLVTNESYTVACELLKERYARPAKIIFAHIEKLLQLGIDDGKDLKVVQDMLLLHIRSLERLGVGGDRYGVILTPLVLSRLPDSFRMEWARESEGRESDLSFLLECLKSEISRKERSQVLESSSTPVETGTQIKKEKTRTATGAGGGAGTGDSAEEARTPRWRRGGRAPSASALHASSARGNQGAAGEAASSRSSESSRPSSSGCGLCQGPLQTAKCGTLSGLTSPECFMKVKQAGLCFACLRAGHRAWHCSARCYSCKGRHHIVCCPLQGRASVSPSAASCDPFRVAAGARAPQPPVTASLPCGDEKATRQCTVLPTAKVLVYGSKGVVEATALFDSGSDRTYVTESLVKRVGVEWVSSQPVSFAAFGGGKTASGDRNVYKMSVKGACVSSCEVKTFSAVAVPVICAPLSRPRVPEACLVDFGELSLADDCSHDRTLCVDILIGLDYYRTMMKAGVMISSSGLTAQDSCFGWVVSGAAADVQCNSSLVACRLLCLGDLSHNEVRKFWELEGIGISFKEGETDDDDVVLQQFESSVRFVDGRYEVALPWKGDVCPEQLQDNRSGAESRLGSLSRKLARDESLSRLYNDALGDMEGKGIVEEVPAEEVDSQNPTYYMPHLPVVRPGSETTKVRPVFDASACGPDGLSLNDCLEAGPSLLPSLTDVLLRFRRHKYAVTGDISKAFL